jgi:hypothetical protein
MLFLQRPPWPTSEVRSTGQSGYTGVIYTGLTKIPDTPQNFTGGYLYESKDLYTGIHFIPDIFLSRQYKNF